VPGEPVVCLFRTCSGLVCGTCCLACLGQFWRAVGRVDNDEHEQERGHEHDGNRRVRRSRSVGDGAAVGGMAACGALVPHSLLCRLGRRTGGPAAGGRGCAPASDPEPVNGATQRRVWARFLRIEGKGGGFEGGRAIQWSSGRPSPHATRFAGTRLAQSVARGARSRATPGPS
jgi:hypothetical protein